MTPKPRKEGEDQLLREKGTEKMRNVISVDIEGILPTNAGKEIIEEGITVEAKVEVAQESIDIEKEVVLQDQVTEIEITEKRELLIRKREVQAKVKAKVDQKAKAEV